MPKKPVSKEAPKTAESDEPPVIQETPHQEPEMPPHPEPTPHESTPEPEAAAPSQQPESMPAPISPDVVAETIELKRSWQAKRDTAIAELLRRRAEIERQLTELEYVEPTSEEPKEARVAHRTTAEAPEWVSPPTAKKRRGRPPKKKAKYQIDPERQAQAIYDRILNRHVNAGKSKREASDLARQASDKYKLKHGIK